MMDLKISVEGPVVFIYDLYAECVS